VLRLTETSRAVVEIVAIAEHVASLTTVAAAFQLNPDVPAPLASGGHAPLIPLGPESNSGESSSTLADIHAWVPNALGVTHVPAIWRALAHDARLLEATWKKDRLVLGAGSLDVVVKGCAALAVAQFRQSAYWINYLTQYLRVSCHFDDRSLVEIAGSVMHYISFNTIAHGMRLPASMEMLDARDVMPGGQFEHQVPGVKRRQAPK
jgi:hypothetical protein